MKKIILSADIGKFETELTGRDVELTSEDLEIVRLRTKMYNLDDGFIDVEGEGSYQVELEGNKYIVGEQGQNKSNDTSKTQLLHKLACYTAITKFIEPGTTENEVYMVLACPISVLLSQEAKEGYKDYIKGEGVIKIKVDDKDYEFEIKEITIKAEGSGILYLEPQRFNSKKVAIVDLGGLNLGWSSYVNGSCKKEDRFIEECGADKLIDIVREQISIYKNGNLISHEVAEKALNDGGTKKGGEIDKDSCEYIQKAKEKYFEEVLGFIKTHKYNIDDYDELIFVGGTTQHIKEIIEKKLKHSYIPNKSQLTTVEGLYKVAFKKYSNK